MEETKEERLFVLILMAAAFAMMLAGFALGWGVCAVQGYDYKERTDTVWMTSTVTHHEPLAVHDTILRWEKIKVPLASYRQVDKPSNCKAFAPDTNVASKSDSITTELQLTQRRYGDSTYTAYISGYRIGDYPRLDSITIHNRTAYISRTIAQKRKPWSIGVGVGYGLCGKQFSPYVGVGVQYKILEF